MPRDYLHNHPEFADLIRIVASEMGIDPGLVEKDYWIMHCLYGLQQLGLTFELKGGTSLSKGFKIIGRFSEDIDNPIHLAIMSLYFSQPLLSGSAPRTFKVNSFSVTPAQTCIYGGVELNSPRQPFRSHCSVDSRGGHLIRQSTLRLFRVETDRSWAAATAAGARLRSRRFIY
jgi:hypothetical protein